MGVPPVRISFQLLPPLQPSSREEVNMILSIGGPDDDKHPNPPPPPDPPKPK